MLKIANQYGNFDLTRKSVPKGYIHVSGERLQPLCRKLRIQFVQAVVSFVGQRKYGYKPRFDGVIVTARSAPKLQRAIEEREERAQSPQAQRKREYDKARRERKKLEMERKRQELNDRLWEMGLDPDSQTAKWYLQGEINKYQAQLIAFKCEYRHEHTTYEEELELERQVAGRYYDPFDAKLSAREWCLEDPIPDNWEEYLLQYGFDSEVAAAMAGVLRDPCNAHPIWFKACELGIQQAIESGKAIDLENLSYQTVAEHRLVPNPDGWGIR